MRADRSFYLAVALSALAAMSSVACGGDRNREVKSAESNLANEQQEARNEDARLQEKQAREQAEAQQKPMTNDDRVELQTKQQDEQAETKADGAKEVAAADKNVTNAYADMQKERSTFEADAKARFEKTNAKANELKNKSAKVPADKRAKFTSEWNTYSGKKSETTRNLTQLSRSTNEEWKDAKAKVEKSLDDLDAAVDRVGGQM